MAENNANKMDELQKKLEDGIFTVMSGEGYRDWLATSSRLYNNYSMQNALLVYLQKPDASYVMGFNEWKEFGRTVAEGTHGAKIYVPVMAKEKAHGAIYREAISELNKQIKEGKGTASYQFGRLEFTMNKAGVTGLKVDGKERGVFSSPRQLEKFIQEAIVGKVPLRYTSATVFDVKDTKIPEFLWVRKGYTLDEMVKGKDGKPIKNRRGEVKIVNTPERQARFRENMDTSIVEKDPDKMKKMYEALVSVSEKNGIPVYEKERGDDETLKGGADGYFSRQAIDGHRGFIVIPKDMDPTLRCSIMFHEIAHSDLHGDLAKAAKEIGEDKITRNAREIQAESVAYATAQRFGIETDTHSFQYMAAWSAGLELQDLKRSMDAIYRETVKLTSEVTEELEARGLNLDLTEKEALTEGQVKDISSQQARYALGIVSAQEEKKSH